MQANRPDSQKINRHQVYLVRCWQESDGSWRYAVEPVDGREAARHGFASQADLLAYLQAVLPDQDESLLWR